MNLPIELKNIIENIASEYKIADLRNTANRISEDYASNSSKGNSMIISDLDVISYAVMRMPATFASVSTALENTLKLIDLDINSVLDVGSGMLTATIATHYLLNKDIKYTCVEREDKMISLGKRLASNYEGLSSINIIKEDYTKVLPEGKFDLVIASYSLNELSDEDRNKVVGTLFDKTNKLLLIVEPGTPVTSKQIKIVREQLINKGGYVVAPCPHMNKCPMEENDWCHFVTRVERSKLHKLLKNADVPYEDEKYSYIAISKEKPTREISYRVLRHPLIGKGNVSLTLCGKLGIENLRLFKKDSLFKEAKKVSCGDYLK